MRILITGNLGYVGSALSRYLRKAYPTAFLAGYDLGYFRDCLTTSTTSPEHVLNAQYHGDVRRFDERLLSGFDHVIHLAAISNNPIGSRFESATLEVNFDATICLAEMSVRQGVKSFVFASTCSVYGTFGDEAKRETAELNPLTAYARSKVLAESGLQRVKGDMKITCLRFATGCGMSDRLRLDLVLNDFVASAFSTGEITVLSDGASWRPLIDVHDMCRATDWAMVREGPRYFLCNTGSNQWNFTVRELAERVRQYFPDVRININNSAPPDKRSYKVNFDKFAACANGYASKSNIDQTIEELKRGLEDIEFSDRDIRHSKLMRLNVLNKFLYEGKLDPELNWVD